MRGMPQSYEPRLVNLAVSYEQWILPLWVKSNGKGKNKV